MHASLVSAAQAAGQRLMSQKDEVDHFKLQFPTATGLHDLVAALRKDPELTPPSLLPRRHRPRSR
jgi:hypothetical protein